MVAVVIFMRGSLLTVCSSLKTALCAEVCWGSSFFLFCPLYHFQFYGPCERHFHHRTTWCLMLQCVAMQFFGVSLVFPYVQFLLSLCKIRWKVRKGASDNGQIHKVFNFSLCTTPTVNPTPSIHMFQHKTPKWKGCKVKINKPKYHKVSIRLADIEKLPYGKKRWDKGAILLSEKRNSFLTFGNSMKLNN